MQITIAITTRNRPNEFEKVVGNIRNHTHCNYQLIIVDDASDEVYCDADYRFETRVGIPSAKNKAFNIIKATKTRDCQKIFCKAYLLKVEFILFLNFRYNK